MTADTTLEGLLATVGPPVLQAVCLPAGPDADAGQPHLFDVTEGITCGPGSVLLAVGCRVGSQRTLALVHDAGAAGVAAVVVKARGDDLGPLTDAALAAGVALLVADDAAPWYHLHGLIASAARSGAVHAPLASVTIGDLFALANAVAAMVGGAVAIEDPQQQVLAYSNLPGQPIDATREAGILGRRVPAEFRQAGTEIWRHRDVKRIELPEIRPRLAVAVRAGTEVLGSIWAVEGEDGFTPDAERLLQDAAHIAALHLLRLRTMSDLARAARSEALRAVLTGRGGGTPGALPSVDTHELTVVGFRPETADETVVERVVELISVYGESFHRNAACLAISGTIYLLLPTAPGADATLLPATAGRVVSRVAESLRIRLRAGIGSTVADLGELARSKDEADRVLQVLAERPDGPAVAGIADVRSRAILLRLQELIAADPQLRSAVVDVMAMHDAERQTQYIATLSAYLDAFGDVPTAAARLVLHQNTFRHRMRRIGELFHVRLDDPDERLVLWLQLRLRD